MAQRSEIEELKLAWRALAGNPSDVGWRTIPVATEAACQLLAGRRFPGNEEAILIGFVRAKIPLQAQLPQGRGFVVLHAELGASGENCNWLAICRQSSGSLDLFSLMAEDLISTTVGLGASNEERLIGVFLSRIWAWQEFMRRGDDSVLKPEAEAGLFGELEILKDLIEIGVQSNKAIEAWQGPLESNQDFLIGSGGFEVKTTVSEKGFTAKIASLEQLDDSAISPLFLVGLRLALGSRGLTLPMQVQQLRTILSEQFGPLDVFNNLLIRAGYIDSSSGQYSRSFLRCDCRVWRIFSEFPRLIQGNVPLAVRKARYELDLDLITADVLSLKEGLFQLGVLE